ncbi:hypothetical protein ACCUM_2846 [Candidatus Accumulibacter phosphatis]|uniref:Uncharacterized protein n=1 Tax=Candidatus Accumulibacter phosphatis TaxID=327160 RepID=A0A5S4EQL0_9PROT|nr:hypothetical protein ACCUM_2846 [Candidatus Accumulibacter phosphatis]
MPFYEADDLVEVFMFVNTTDQSPRMRFACHHVHRGADHEAVSSI